MLTVILFTLCLPLYAKDEAMQTNKPSNPTTNALLQCVRKSAGDHVGHFDDPKVVAADDDLRNKIVKIKKIMKETRASKARGPQTIKEAYDFLRQNLSMAYLPTKCVEHDGVFYFSGGTSAKPIEDFSSGFAIRKGESQIYTWSESEETGVNKEK